MAAVTQNFRDLWSATGFADAELEQYAQAHMLADTRFGLRALALLALIAQVGIAGFAFAFNASSSITHTNVMLAVLAAHIIVSAHFVRRTNELYMLGIAFLIVNAVAVTVLAHRLGELDVGTISSSLMLLIAIPLVPWALREVSIIIGLIYVLQTLSLYSVPGRFDPQSLVILQFLTFGSAIVVVAIVSRNTYTRKQSIRAQFELEETHRQVEKQSMQDHLTGAWNRRFLDAGFPAIVELSKSTGQPLHMAVLDVDDFKLINDCMGHDAGDELLVVLVSELKKLVEDNGHVVRLGGDEFQILYLGEDLQPLIDTAIDRLRRSIPDDQKPGDIDVGVSAGIATMSANGPIDYMHMYKAADQALYQEKHGRSAANKDSSMDPALVMTGRWRI